MKMIKTYESFIETRLLDKDDIDSFLYDLKDISFGYSYNKFYNKIIYCFFIKNYDNKKEEIKIFLEEIESAAKSIDVKFKYFINPKILIIFNKKYNDDEIYKSDYIPYIILTFYISEPPVNYDIYATIGKGINKFNLDSIYTGSQVYFD